MQLETKTWCERKKSFVVELPFNPFNRHYYWCSPTNAVLSVGFQEREGISWHSWETRALIDGKAFDFTPFALLLPLSCFRIEWKRPRVSLRVLSSPSSSIDSRELHSRTQFYSYTHARMYSIDLLLLERRTWRFIRERLSLGSLYLCLTTLDVLTALFKIRETNTGTYTGLLKKKEQEFGLSRFTWFMVLALPAFDFSCQTCILCCVAVQ